MLYEDGAPTASEQKNKRATRDAKARRAPKGHKNGQGRSRAGVGNGAWFESLYGNEKLRRKSVERDARTP